MKVLGLSCGRKMGNTEIFIKEALMAAKEKGADVEIIRLNDLNIKPCTGCNACVVDLLYKNGAGHCMIKGDDYDFIDEKLMECDGLIVGSPIYEKGVTGLLKTLNDRFGPSHDVSFKMISKNARKEKGITDGKAPDERSFKRRVASLIAMGGSEWDTLAIPMLNMFTLPFQMDIVDQVLINWTALPGSVVFNDQAIERARKTGIHIVESLLDEKQEVKYIGDKGVCPICHSKLFEIRDGDNNSPTVCAVCGVRGTLNVENGKVNFELSKDVYKNAHVNLSGKLEHAREITEISLKSNPLSSELPERLKKYKDFLEYSIPEV